MFTRRFLFLTVLFIVVFSILFLQLYSPFSSTYWFTIRESYKFLGTVTMYTFSVLFLISSKVLLMDLNRRYGIGGWGLILYSLAEVLVVSIIYTAITLLVQQNNVTLVEDRQSCPISVGQTPGFRNRMHQSIGYSRYLHT